MQKGRKSIMFGRCFHRSSAVYVGNVKVPFKWNLELTHEQGGAI